MDGNELEVLRDGLEALVDAGGAEWEAPVFTPATSARPEGTPIREGVRRREVAAAGAVLVVTAIVFALLSEPSPPPDADDTQISLTLDVVNQPGTAGDRGVYRTGKTLGALNSENHTMKVGWLVEGYIWTEGRTVVGRFTKMFPPAGSVDQWGEPFPREVSICMFLEKTVVWSRWRAPNLGPSCSRVQTRPGSSSRRGRSLDGHQGEQRRVGEVAPVPRRS